MNVDIHKRNIRSKNPPILTGGASKKAKGQPEEYPIFCIQSFRLKNDKLDPLPIRCRQTKDSILAVWQSFKPGNQPVAKIALGYPKREVNNTVSLNYIDLYPTIPSKHQISELLSRSEEEFKIADNKTEYIEMTPTIASDIMTDEEFEIYNQNVFSPDYNFDSLLTEISSRCELLKGKGDPEIFSTHVTTMLEMLGENIMVTLAYLLEKEIETIKYDGSDLSNYTRNLIAGLGVAERGEFKDVRAKIAEMGADASQYKFYYSNYHMLKSMCFILHDKPVNSLVKPLHDTMKARFVKYAAELRLNFAMPEITNLWAIWGSEFGLPDRAMVTQDRCHKVLDRLVSRFAADMKTKNIIIPNNVKMFSVPYRSYESSNLAKEELTKILAKYSNGLADATGNDKYIVSFLKRPIFPHTVAFQNAARTPLSDRFIVSERVESKQEEGGKDKLTASYTLSGPDLDTNPFSIEPLRFGDICIYHTERGGERNLYYAAEGCFSDAAVAELREPGIGERILTSHGLVGLKGVDKIPPFIWDNNLRKALIAVVNGAVSQNETIPLVKDAIPGILGSSRGGRKTSEADIRRKMTWIGKLKGNLDNEVRIILAAFVKEAGDQSKIQIVENLCRRGQKTYLTTVDGYLSESIINGGVLFKGGSVNFYEHEGFDLITEADLEKFAKIRYLLNIYTYEALDTQLNKFISACKDCLRATYENIKPVFSPLYFIYLALFHSIDGIKPKKEEDFNRFVKKPFDKYVFSGVESVRGLINRMLRTSKIEDIYTVYNNHTETPFTYVDSKNITRTTLSEIIKDICEINFANVEVNNQVIITNLSAIFEQCPFLMMLDQIRTLKKTIHIKEGRESKDINIEASPLGTQILESLKTAFKKKCQFFCSEYGPIAIDSEKVWVYLYTNNTGSAPPGSLVLKDYRLDAPAYDDKVTDNYAESSLSLEAGKAGGSLKRRNRNIHTKKKGQRTRKLSGRHRSRKY